MWHIKISNMTCILYMLLLTLKGYISKNYFKQNLIRSSRGFFLYVGWSNLSLCEFLKKCLDIQKNEIYWGLNKFHYEEYMVRKQWTYYSRVSETSNVEFFQTNVKSLSLTVDFWVDVYTRIWREKKDYR